jgi:hypothetical protein
LCSILHLFRPIKVAINGSLKNGSQANGLTG